MKKLTYLLLFIGLTGSVLSAKAQQADTAKMHDWSHHDVAGAAQIQITYRKAKIDQLNRALNANGFANINPDNVWINASMSHINHSWIMENGIGFTPVSSTENNNVKVKYNQYQLYGRMGYNVSNSTDFRLFPFVGLNFSAAILDIQDKNNTQAAGSLTNEILTQSATKILYQPNFGVELGAGFDGVIKMKTKQVDCITIERSIPIGLRVGYYINTYASDWKLDNYSVSSNGANQKQSQVFVSFNIGLGYEIKKN